MTRATPVVALMFSPVRVTLKRLPPTNSPYVTFMDGALCIEISPSLTASPVHGHAEPLGRHLQQDPARLCGHAARGPGVAFDRIRPTRPALIDRNVGAAHDQRGLLEGDVQLVAHQLEEGGSGALPPVGLADVEGRRAVLVNRDP